MKLSKAAAACIGHAEWLAVDERGPSLERAVAYLAFAIEEFEQQQAAQFHRLTRASTVISPLRDIVRREVHYVKWEWCFGHPGAHSVTLTLSCGHVVRMKGSKAPLGKLRARCFECTRLTSNTANAIRSAAR